MCFSIPKPIKTNSWKEFRSFYLIHNIPLNFHKLVFLEKIFNIRRTCSFHCLSLFSNREVFMGNWNCLVLIRGSLLFDYIFFSADHLSWMGSIEWWSFRFYQDCWSLICSSTRELRKSRPKKIIIYCLCIFSFLGIAKVNDTLILGVSCTNNLLNYSKSYKIYWSN